MAGLAPVSVLRAQPAAAVPGSPSAPPPPAWLAEVDVVGAPGTLPPPRPFGAVYRLRWNRVEGARAEVSFRPGPGAGEVQTRVDAQTEGWARTLFQMDARHLSVARLDGLRSVRTEHVESRLKRREVYQVTFADNDPGGMPAAIRSHRKAEPPDAPERPEGKDKRFAYPAMRDMNTTFLFLRSLPLADGDQRTLVVMTAKSPYLLRVRVVGREPVTTAATGRQPAIVLDVGLNKIDSKTGTLKPHKLFKSARVWLGDDADRMLLRVDSQIFIGRVSMELERLTK